MSEIAALAPQKVWEIFDLICSIPHISKHETALAQALYSKAVQAGLDAVIDETGNLIIDRPAAPGFENTPRVILQAHMDMVPASEGEFDFVNNAITACIDGNWVRAKGTTLGADDGIGVAHAMAVLLDKEFKCGAINGIFTVDEEAGMSGARNLAPHYLQGKYLLNLDGSNTGFCIGCAGGARQEFTMTAAAGKVDPAKNFLSLNISGLPGGHSGVCIDKNRGNSIKFMAEFIDQLPDAVIASFRGGTADNAIPYQATAEIMTSQSAAEVQKLADAFVIMLKKDCQAAKDMTLTVSDSKASHTVFSPESTRDLLNAIILAPNEVIDVDDDLGIVKTSSNLAMINTTGLDICIRTSQRSLDDNDRDAICAALKAHFEIFNAKSDMGDIYPATTPKMDTGLLKTAVACAKKMNKTHTPYAIHAGLESGWFSQKNPDLEIITCGPDHTGIHTPEEKLNITSVGQFDSFLRELLTVIANNQ
ncbi:MAG: beta-Ala-His dipeptidase [Lentisphaeria bacterium]|nr:beta-Ala-His dipeptidase [Lentisphaeria bacterium]